jgi:spermidine/putrescine transport system ATP-binding protein
LQNNNEGARHAARRDELLRLEGITKSFGGVPVLKGIDLSVRQGEFITLLGASGCGKTTTIRVIAGFEQPDSGRVWLDGRDVTELEPNRRNVNTVFQNYALFPHMNVEANIAYSLKIRKYTKAEIREEVTRILETVRLEGFEKRMPHELSGGQRQRVAIARAVVNNPKALLLDEPLGALDLQLRRQMQIELKRLQQKLNIAFIYITHDQEEALNMSDRIAVMRDGLFEQIGAAAEIYDRPATDYVARFVGNANILIGYAPDGLLAPGMTIAVRSENIVLTPGGRQDGFLSEIGATITDKSFTGGLLRISATLEDGAEVVASRHGVNSDLTVGQRVCVGWAPDDAVAVKHSANAAADAGAVDYLANKAASRSRGAVS